MVLISGSIDLIRLLLKTVTVTTYMIAINCNGCNDLRLNFPGPTECQGQSGNNFILNTFNNMERAECTKVCYKTYQCMLFFYNSMTRSCSLHNRPLTDIEMTPDENSSCYVDDNLNRKHQCQRVFNDQISTRKQIPLEYRQICEENIKKGSLKTVMTPGVRKKDITESWIMEFISVSSFFSGYPPSHLVGPPDKNDWSSEIADQEDTIEVRFSCEMYIEQIHIYELHHVGGVREISLLTPKGTWYPVWSTDQLEVVNKGETGRILSPNIEITHFKTSTVRIVTGPRSKFEQIDAVQVLGKTQKTSVRLLAS